MTSRRRAWQRVKSVSEKLQDRFERMNALYLLYPNSPNPLEMHEDCGNSTTSYIAEDLWNCVARECKKHNRKDTCLKDKFCAWVELPKQTLKP